MKLIKDINFLIVGLGLLGGSYAKGLRNIGFKVSAITKNQDDIDYALENGIIDNGTTEIDTEIIGDADVVIFALYPHVFIDWIKENQKCFKNAKNTNLNCLIVRTTSSTIRSSTTAVISK